MQSFPLGPLDTDQASRAPTARTMILRPVAHDEGLSDARIRGQQRRGNLVRVWPGCFVPAEVVTPATDRIVAVAARSRVRAVSHESAALVHGLPLVAPAADEWPHTNAVAPSPSRAGSGRRYDGRPQQARPQSGEVHVTVAGATGAKRRPGLVVHSGPLAADEVVLHHGTRVTSVARTLIDLARTHPMATGVAAADFALHMGLVTAAELRRALDRGTGRTGVAAARRALIFADGRAESPGESLTRYTLHRLGFPAPELQFDVLDADRTFLGRPDLGYPEHAVLVEFDGRVKYADDAWAGRSPGDVVFAEKLREDRLRDAGFVVVRVTWSDLRNPEELRDRIGRARQRGRRATSSGMVTGTVVRRPRIGID